MVLLDRRPDVHVMFLEGESYMDFLLKEKRCQHMIWAIENDALIVGGVDWTVNYR